MALFSWLLWTNLMSQKGIIYFSICSGEQAKRRSFHTYIFPHGFVFCCWPRWLYPCSKGALGSSRIANTGLSHRTTKEVLYTQKSASHCSLSLFWSVWTGEWKVFNSQKRSRNSRGKGPNWEANSNQDTKLPDLIQHKFFCQIYTHM